ncbi:hypothetical protein FA15DRAFT_675522 [Coprinopsis marcescibilis]|uniref:Uncharacterized protein n=1 Tax=Coprinopsis marcescibilis TaxID=230819 RepID=A0A5C3KE34_COPMA|nr:hypothetical protein FA15DRAFT_675522 [Coprinopsis marcescibilis]
MDNLLEQLQYLSPGEVPFEARISDPVLKYYATQNKELPTNLLQNCRRRIQDLRAMISLLDEKRSSLLKDLSSYTTTPELEALKCKRETLCEEKSAHIYLLAPFRHLPAELIAHIIKSSFPRILMTSSDRNHFLKLRHICPLWRSIAFATPELWRGLKVDTIPSGNTQNFFDTLARWYNRGGQGAEVALSIDLEMGFPYGQSNIDSFLSFLNGRKWIYLAILDLSPTNLLGVVAHWQEAPCSTERLTLTCSSRSPPTLTSAKPLSAILPRMTALFLNKLRLNPFQHSSITSLHLGRDIQLSSPQTLASLLSPVCLPQLEEVILSLTGLRQESNAADSTHAILSTNPMVKTVIVRGMKANCSLRWLEFPQLQFLRIEGLDGIWGRTNIKDVEDVGRIVARLTATPQFHTLSLENSGIYAQNLASLISIGAQQVRRLHVADYDFFRWIETSGSNLALRNLQVLVCTDTWSPYSLDGIISRGIDQVVQWLRSRRLEYEGPKDHTIAFYECPWEEEEMYAVDRPYKDNKYDEAVAMARTAGATILTRPKELIYDMVNYPLHCCSYKLASSEDRYSIQEADH